MATCNAYTFSNFCPIFEYNTFHDLYIDLFTSIKTFKQYFCYGPLENLR